MKPTTHLNFRIARFGLDGLGVYFNALIVSAVWASVAWSTEQGGWTQTLVNQGEGSSIEYHLTDDEAYLIYTLKRPNDNGKESLFTYQLATQERFFIAAGANILEAHTTPNLNRLVYTVESAGSISLYSSFLDGSDVKKLATYLQNNTITNGDQLKFSNDSSTVVYRTPDAMLFSVPIVGGPSLKIADTVEETFSVKGNSHVIYATGFGQFGVRDIKMSSITVNGLAIDLSQNITSESILDFKFSPDDAVLFVLSDAATDCTNLFYVKATALQGQLLTPIKMNIEGCIRPFGLLSYQFMANDRVFYETRSLTSDTGVIKYHSNSFAGNDELTLNTDQSGALVPISELVSRERISGDQSKLAFRSTQGLYISKLDEEDTAELLISRGALNDSEAPYRWYFNSASTKLNFIEDLDTPGLRELYEIDLSSKTIRKMSSADFHSGADVKFIFARNANSEYLFYTSDQIIDDSLDMFRVNVNTRILERVNIAYDRSTETVPTVTNIATTLDGENVFYFVRTYIGEQSIKLYHAKREITDIGDIPCFPVQGKNQALVMVCL